MTDQSNSKAKRPAKRRRAHRIPKQGLTFWHTLITPLLVRTLPSGYVIDAEVLVSRQPQRADIVIVRRQEGKHISLGVLVALFDRLNETTVLELKGATDSLAASDVSKLLGVGCQLLAKEDIEPGSLTLGVLAPRLTQPFLERLKRHGGTLERVRPGEWDGSIAGYPLFVLELEEVWKADERNRYFIWLTQRALTDAAALVPRTKIEEMLFYELELLLSDPSRWRESQMETRKSLDERWREARAGIMRTATPEQRMEGLQPEERLRGLSAEEVLSRYSLEDRLRNLKPEERLRGLQPEERLRGLQPEERLRGLQPEELAALKKLLGS